MGGSAPGRARKGRKSLSTFKIARLIEVDPGSVANWIDGGMLKAYRTPGGHRRVAVEDLVDFLREHEMPIPVEFEQPPPRILIVDDEPAVTRRLAKAIRSSHPDYEVVEVHDGFRAGTTVARLRPDVVILDLRMPAMDGFEICRMIKSQEETSHAAVIVVAARPSQGDRKETEECGADAYMAKPPDLRILVEHVEAALAKRRFRNSDGARDESK